MWISTTILASVIPKTWIRVTASPDPRHGKYITGPVSITLSAIISIRNEVMKFNDNGCFRIDKNKPTPKSFQWVQFFPRVQFHGNRDFWKFIKDLPKSKPGVFTPVNPRWLNKKKKVHLKQIWRPLVFRTRHWSIPSNKKVSTSCLISILVSPWSSSSLAVSRMSKKSI